jgi:hypothetical protein
MQPPPLLQLIKPATAVALVVGVLWLGIGSPAWATPDQRPMGQTVPTITPGGAVRATPTPKRESSSGCYPSVQPPTEPAPEGAVRHVTAPGCGATLVAGDGSIIISDEAPPFANTAQLSPAALSDLPPANTGMTLLGKQAIVTLFDAQGKRLSNQPFAAPVQVCFSYSDSDLASGGVRAADLVIQQYDDTLKAWAALATSAATEPQRACGQTTSPGTFALAAPTNALVNGVQSRTDGRSDPLLDSNASLLSIRNAATDRFSWWVWALAAVVIVAALVLLGITRRRRAQRVSSQ